MEKEKAIEVLNSLITINNDRIEGYETASKETEEFDLKAMFAQFISTSKSFKQELVREVNKLGARMPKVQKFQGNSFACGWMLRQRSQAKTAKQF